MVVLHTLDGTAVILFIYIARSGERRKALRKCLDLSSCLTMAPSSLTTLLLSHRSRLAGTHSQQSMWSSYTHLTAKLGPATTYAKKNIPSPPDFSVICLGQQWPTNLHSSAPLPQRFALSKSHSQRSMWYCRAITTSHRLFK